ncbi:hypothetical protein RhiirA4_476750 [Rhizophagus irregularis]|uniref:Uncharacterized protein n=1 Tax=Rhizophagus irregularis TaxID=588596 RepID=A0A2I1HC49_9GLOM|nr:hypothetical protein RhiirA4_476750 [Rhizophagus irregularis]
MSIRQESIISAVDRANDILNFNNHNTIIQCESEIFDDLIDTTEKALTLLKEQKSAGNIKWCKSAMKSFNGIIKLAKEVEQYQRKRTMPLTWKDHTNSTRYLH